MIKLIIGLSITTIMQFANNASNNDNQSLIYLVILVLSLFSLAKMVHSMVESFFTGFAANNSNFGQRVGQAGLSSITNSIKDGASNMVTSAKSQLSSIKANQTTPNSISSSRQTTNGVNRNNNSMNNPITMSSVGKAIGKGTLRATVGTLKAVADIGGSMAKEALDVRHTSNFEKSTPTEQHKKFPTNYTPPTQNSSK